MAKKKQPSPDYVDRIWVGLEALCCNREEELDFLLVEFRRAQSEGETADAKMNHLAPMIKKQMEEMGLDRRVTKTRRSRTEGILTYAAKALGGVTANIKAAKIRREVKKVMGAKAAAQAVTSTRKTTWSINWKLIEKGGPELVETIRGITGTKAASLEVKPTSKQSRSGKKGKRRAGRKK